DRSGAEDNFFELGGHSLLSVRVIAAIEKKTGGRMDPRILFFQKLGQVAAGAALARAPVDVGAGGRCTPSTSAPDNRGRAGATFHGARGARARARACYVSLGGRSTVARTARCGSWRRLWQLPAITCCASITSAPVTRPARWRRP